MRLVDWLNGTAVTALGGHTTWAELLGFATGLVTVWLVVRQHVALLMVAFWGVGLYADAGLQIVFLGPCGLGLRAWRADLARVAAVPA